MFLSLIGKTCQLARLILKPELSARDPYGQRRKMIYLVQEGKDMKLRRQDRYISGLVFCLLILSSSVTTGSLYRQYKELFLNFPTWGNHSGNVHK